ncbi:MAG: divergent polysaccharide deacetylase family protein, partial [Acetobacteraceae bacterium]|nr:divergent polysaccharide deacetylase family protein [Acetobacteraceae bacterium]
AQMDPVLRQIAARGLIYIDPRPGAAPPAGVWGRSVDVVIDEPANRPEIDAKLAELEQIARDRGSALGLAGAVRPVTVDRINAWASGLGARGLALAPVSALAEPPPPDQEAER